MNAASPDTRGEVIYVSWGGTGRGAALRIAHDRAAHAELGLVYLAILDPPHFADLDGALLNLVVEELTWLLEAHTRMISSADDRPVPIRVVVRTGEVDDEVESLVAETGADTVLVGAPVPVAGHGTVDELISALRSRTGADVELVEATDGRGIV